MRLPIVFIASLLPVAAWAAPAGDGLFAVFETNHGSFACELFYDRAPVTVANFVRLAEGTPGWLDLETGLVEKNPFYDGLTFHRVIPNFMIQSGSRNGQGTDGPGYQFPDEFHPELIHEGPGILSMANSGIDTNGSQFFITVASTRWLDYKHAVFGRVVEGMANVTGISEVDTDAGDQPLEPVVIHSVEIVRNGAAARAFDVSAPPLPRVGEVPGRMAAADSVLTVRFGREPKSGYTLSYSPDLEGWSRENVELSGEAGEEAFFDVSALAAEADRQFYRVVEVDSSRIPEAYFPESLVGKTLDLDFVSDDLRIVLYPDQEPPDGEQVEPIGTGDVGDDLGRDLNYIWFQDKSRGVLYFKLEGYVQFDLQLLFLDQESGTFSGIARTGSQPTVSGLFTLKDRE